MQGWMDGQIDGWMDGWGDLGDCAPGALLQMCLGLAVPRTVPILIPHAFFCLFCFEHLDSLCCCFCLPMNGGWPQRKKKKSKGKKKKNSSFLLSFCLVFVCDVLYFSPFSVCILRWFLFFGGKWPPSSHQCIVQAAGKQRKLEPMKELLFLSSHIAVEFWAIPKFGTFNVSTLGFVFVFYVQLSQHIC